MKVNVQTVNKATFSVNVADDATLKDLKDEVLKTQEYKIQKGVFKGKVLKDDEVLSAAGIVENEKIVVIGSKAANVPPPKEEKKEETPPPAAAPEASTAPAPAPQSETVSSAVDAYVTGDEMEETISTIMAAHDFPREKVVRALRAAFFNPDRAFEFLITDSIPDIPEEQAPPTGGGAPAGAGGAGAPAQGSTGGGGGGGGAPAGGMAPAFNIPGVGTVTAEQTAEIMAILARGNPGASPPDPQALGQFLAQLSRLNQMMAGGGAGGGGGNAPAPAQGGGGSAGGSALRQALSQISEFPEICRQIRNNPAALETMLETLRGSSPELFALITANQEEFLQIIRESGDGGGEGGGPPPGAIVISAADRQAIDRLMQLGFTEQQAAQAYLASERNEELAANLLFNSMGE